MALHARFGRAVVGRGRVGARGIGIAVRGVALAAGDSVLEIVIDAAVERRAVVDGPTERVRVADGAHVRRVRRYAAVVREVRVRAARCAERERCDGDEPLRGASHERWSLVASRVAGFVPARGNALASHGNRVTDRVRNSECPSAERSWLRDCDVVARTSASGARAAPSEESRYIRARAIERARTRARRLGIERMVQLLLRSTARGADGSCPAMGGGGARPRNDAPDGEVRPRDRRRHARSGVHGAWVRRELGAARGPARQGRRRRLLGELVPAVRPRDARARSDLPAVSRQRARRDRRQHRRGHGARPRVSPADPRLVPGRRGQRPRRRGPLLTTDDAEHVHHRPARHHPSRPRRVPRRRHARARRGDPGAPAIHRAVARVATLAATLALSSPSGCAIVQPYEREQLARPDMQFGGAEALHGAEAHATEVREGAAGGFEAAAGGCGCN